MPGGQRCKRAESRPALRELRVEKNKPGRKKESQGFAARALAPPASQRPGSPAGGLLCSAAMLFPAGVPAPEGFPLLSRPLFRPGAASGRAGLRESRERKPASGGHHCRSRLFFSGSVSYFCERLLMKAWESSLCSGLTLTSIKG